MKRGDIGPRSLIRTRTLKPVPGLVTSTQVPSGSVRCAAVICVGSKRSPDAVLWPFNRSPYQLATPTSAPPVAGPVGAAGAGVVAAGGGLGGCVAVADAVAVAVGVAGGGASPAGAPQLSESAAATKVAAAASRRALRDAVAMPEFCHAASSTPTIAPPLPPRFRANAVPPWASAMRFTSESPSPTEP